MTESAEKNSRKRDLCSFFGDSVNFQPQHPILLKLLSQKKISSADFCLFSALVAHGWFTLWGETKFFLSNKEMQDMTGGTDKTIRKSLQVFLDLKFLKIKFSDGRKKNLIEINISEIIKSDASTTEKFRSSDDPIAEKFRSKPRNNSVVKGPQPRKNSVVNYGIFPQSLITEYSSEFLSESLHRFDEKFFEHAKREKFKSDVVALIGEGISFESIVAVLETQVESFEKIQSFYAFIKSKKDKFTEIEQNYEYLLKKKKEQIELREIDRAKQTQLAQEIKITVPEGFGKPRGLKTRLNENKGVL